MWLASPQECLLLLLLLCAYTTSLAAFITPTSAKEFVPSVGCCPSFDSHRYRSGPPTANVVAGPIFPHYRRRPSSHTAYFIKGLFTRFVVVDINPASSWLYPPAYSGISSVASSSLPSKRRRWPFPFLPGQKFTCEHNQSQQAVCALKQHPHGVKAGMINGLRTRQNCLRSCSATRYASSAGVSRLPLHTAAAPYNRKSSAGAACSKNPSLPPEDAPQGDPSVGVAGRNKDEVKKRCISGNAGVISITARARDRLRELKANQSLSGERQGQEAGFFLRLGVQSGGCSGLSYVLNVIDRDAVASTDLQEKFEDDEGGSPTVFVTVVVDPKSLLYVVGTVLDYSDDLIGGGFRVSNPNASRSCGCGMSFGVPKTFAQHLIDSKPQSCSTTGKKKTAVQSVFAH